MNERPVWRSLLYVPANVERFVRSAASRGADAVQLDLEDSVAPNEKEAARRAVGPAAASLAAAGIDVIVRINRPPALAIADIEASVAPGVRALALPKVMGPEHIRLLAEAVEAAELRCGMTAGTTAFIAMVETAQAALMLPQICSAHPRVAAVTLGTEDLASDLGTLPDSPAFETLTAALVASARAAGVQPLGLVGSIAEIGDLERFRAVVRRSRSFGLTGSSCVHPSQVPILNDEFSPGVAEVERARRVVRAYDEALTRGTGAIAVEGKMIDVPIAERARALLARHAAIQAKRKEAAS